ncbi:MAG: GNAT family N-acetyltransferase [Isosphaeraceae bacterium]
MRPGPGLGPFRTARLLARPIRLDHFHDLRLLHGDPVVMRTLSRDGLPLSVEASRTALAVDEAHWAQHRFGLWMFYDVDTSEFVGRGGLKVFRFGEKEVVGLAYAVVASRSGRGYATEIGAASLWAGFRRLKLPQIDCWTLPQNLASQRVMQKLGFRYSHETLFADLPHRYYTLLPSDLNPPDPVLSWNSD